MYYVGRLWLHFLVFAVEMSTAVWTAYMAVKTLQTGDDVRLAIVCIIGALAVLTRFPVKFVPVYMYLYRLPKVEERRKLALLDADGVPTVRPKNQWIKPSKGIAFWLWLEPVTNFIGSMVVIYVLLGGPLPGVEYLG